MTEHAQFPVLQGQFQTITAAPMPATIDYPAALALRRMAQTHGDMPEYLLAVEVGALLHYLPDLPVSIRCGTPARALTRGWP